jgi:hypothetical protein
MNPLAGIVKQRNFFDSKGLFFEKKNGQFSDECSNKVYKKLIQCAKIIKSKRFKKAEAAISIVSF